MPTTPAVRPASLRRALLWSIATAAGLALTWLVLHVLLDPKPAGPQPQGRAAREPGSAPPAATGAPLAWDFSKSTSCVSIGWVPENAHSQRLLIQGPRRVYATLPDGRKFQSQAALVQLLEEEGEVVGFAAYLPVEDLDSAHATASRLLAEWNLPRHREIPGVRYDPDDFWRTPTLEEWRDRKKLLPPPDRHDPRGHNWDGVERHGPDGITISLAIRDSFAVSEPRWTVVWGVDWRGIVRPATQPSTAPSTRGIERRDITALSQPYRGTGFQPVCAGRCVERSNER